MAERMGRTPVQAADQIGFVGNRCARPFSLEGLRLLGARVAGHEQIDRICRLGGGFRMGPFELTDLVGIDVNLDVANSFWEQSFHEPRWQPHPIQTRMVASGRLGRKAGRGLLRLRLSSPPPRGPVPSRRPRRRPDPGSTSTPGRSPRTASGRCGSSTAASTHSPPARMRSASWPSPTSNRRGWSS